MTKHCSKMRNQNLVLFEKMMIVLLIYYWLCCCCCSSSADAQLIPITLQPPPANFNRVVSKAAQCDNGNIYLTIRFDRPFGGVIYSDGAFGTPNCHYVDGSAVPSLQYNVTIPLNQCNSETFANGTKRNTVIVQRDTRILELWDNKFILTCNAADGSQGLQPLESQFTVTLGGVTVEGTLASTELVTNSGVLASTINYTVEVQQGVGPFSQPVSRVLNVGEPISYVVRLRNLRSNDAQVGLCWATDDISKIQLSDNDGCTVLPSGNVWNNFKTAQNNTADPDSKLLYNNIKAWAFPTSTRVNIFCNLHICVSSCVQPQCNVTLKKRDSDYASSLKTPPAEIVKIAGGFEVNGMLSHSDKLVSSINSGEQQRDSAAAAVVVITVSPPNAKAAVAAVAANSSSDDDERICMSYANFVAGVVLVLLVFILCLVVVAILTYKLYHVKRQESNLHSPTSSNSPPRDIKVYSPYHHNDAFIEGANGDVINRSDVEDRKRIS